MTRDEMFAYALTQPGAEDSTLFDGRCIRVRGHWEPAAICRLGARGK